MSSKKQRKKLRLQRTSVSQAQQKALKIKDPVKKNVPELIEEFRKMFSQCSNEEEFFEMLANSLFRAVNCNPRRGEYGPYWTPFEKIKEFFTAAASNKWQWYLNSSCKYVNFWVDTRDCACLISNREQKMISIEELMYQYRHDSETKKEQE